METKTQEQMYKVLIGKPIVPHLICCVPAQKRHVKYRAVTTDANNKRRPKYTLRNELGLKTNELATYDDSVHINATDSMQGDS